MNNSFDHLDTEYYVERAYQLRSEYVAAAVKSLVARIKSALTSGKRSTAAPLQGNPAH
ncbi:RSP_7527 family protein [Marinomonas gallaica]|uniref:RSP_7527 family protein n=1 Tax=Marinomonas gallaica TaxID=1806667 RepID=UPI003A90B9B7